MSDGRRETGDNTAPLRGDALELRALPVVGEGEPNDGSAMQRRDMVRMLVGVPLAALAVRFEDVERAATHAADVLQAAQQRGAQFKPKFFTPDEWATVRLLSDLVIPRDARSGSATDAGVPEFMDFMMTAYPDIGKNIRTGLAWLDGESRKGFGKTFVQGTTAQQTALLDRIAYPKKATAAMKDGVEFFTRFRNLTASGFWSSKVGVADLQYVGNRPQAAWNGCPPAALAKLGVRYKS